jgi:hypothetical protein
MATSPDHPELQFVQASGYTRGRPGRPLWIVIHDMEAHETPTTAENTAQYFATGAGGRSVSSHYCADNNSIVQCVLLDDTAWTVGNSQGNGRGINWELSGFASQTREQWLDPFGVAMLGLCAPIMVSDAARYGIPLRRCTVDELKAGRPGITSHNDLGLAFGGTDHTDPGPNFPWDYLLALLNGEEVMSPQQSKDLWFACWRIAGIEANADPIVIPANVSSAAYPFDCEQVEEPNQLAKAIAAGGGPGVKHHHTTGDPQTDE